MKLTTIIAMMLLAAVATAEESTPPIPTPSTDWIDDLSDLLRDMNAQGGLAAVGVSPVVPTQPQTEPDE